MFRGAIKSSTPVSFTFIFLLLVAWCLPPCSAVAQSMGIHPLHTAFVGQCTGFEWSILPFFYRLSRELCRFYRQPLTAQPTGIHPLLVAFVGHARGRNGGCSSVSRRKPEPCLHALGRYCIPKVSRSEGAPRVHFGDTHEIRCLMTVIRQKTSIGHGRLAYGVCKRP